MPFKKGQSGNPAGRAKVVIDVQLAARKRTMENFRLIEKWANQEVEPNVALKAAIALHEIAWGKPGQRIEMTGKEGGPVVYKWQDSPAQVPPT